MTARYSAFRDPDIHSALMLLTWGGWLLLCLCGLLNTPQWAARLTGTATLETWTLLAFLLALGTLLTLENSAARRACSLASLFFWLFVLGLLLSAGPTLMIPTALIVAFGEACRYWTM